MRHRVGHEKGAASVEFVMVLPLVVVALLLIVQVALLVATQLSVQHAAREGARVAAIWNDDARARDAALEAGALEADRASIEITPSQRTVGDPVQVRVSYRPIMGVPYISAFVPAGIVLSATVEQRTERASP